MANGNPPVRIRNQTYGASPEWSFRVMRSVSPNQFELEAQLARLTEHTREIVRYKKIGGLGVTLVMLDPVMHKIMGVSRHERISLPKLQKLEQDVNDAFSQTQHDEYKVPVLDRFAPYGLYGFKKPYLGLRLKSTYADEQLAADRDLIINHIVDNYPVGEAELRRGLRGLEPHITLGTVLWDELEPYQQADLKKDPSQFIRGYMREAVNKRKAEGFETSPLPVIPETICLDGLQAFCERK